MSFKKESYYTDRYNNDADFRGNLSLWALSVIVAIVIGLIFTLPTWVNMLIDINIGVWLILAAIEIYRHMIVKAPVFLIGFWNLVMGLVKLKELL